MKGLIARTLAAVALLALTGFGNVNATPIEFDFIGAYTFSDTAGDGDTFMETLTLTPSTIITSDLSGGQVRFSPLTLTPGASSPFSFSPSVYPGGFSIFNNSGDELLVATLTVSSFETDGGTGNINSQLGINLTDIVAGSGYAGGSDTIDAFLASAVGGITTVTLQTGQLLADRIVNAGGSDGSSFVGGYSGVATVPEPASLALVGMGLLGLAGVARRRKSNG